MVNPSEGLKHRTPKSGRRRFPVRRMVNPSEGLKHTMMNAAVLIMLRPKDGQPE